MEFIVGGYVRKYFKYLRTLLTKTLSLASSGIWLVTRKQHCIYNCLNCKLGILKNLMISGDVCMYFTVTSLVRWCTEDG